MKVGCLTMFETVKVENGREWYYNADKKLVSRLCDDTLAYRVKELEPQVINELNKARRIYRYPSKELIDTAIAYQRESVKKAVRYVNYKLLGEFKYLDVFGVAALEEYGRDDLKARLSDLETKIDIIYKILTKNA